MTLYCDIDGTIRNLAGIEPNEWDAHDILSMVDKNMSILLDARPYNDILDVLNDMNSPLYFLSAQPKKWRPFTMRWLKEYITNEWGWQAWFVEKSIDKLAELNKGDILIDDYPLFDRYDQIWLIDRRYNRNINIDVPVRIRNGDELRKMLINGE